MAKKDMDDFINTLRNDGELARAFAEAVAGMARDAGHDVTEEDVLEKFVDGDTPSPRPLPGEDDDFDGGVTTAAIGEEGGAPRPRPSTEAVGEEGGRGSPSVTLAIGEEDRRGPKPPRRGGGVTTMAMGEEGGPRF